MVIDVTVINSLLLFFFSGGVQFDYVVPLWQQPDAVLLFSAYH